MTATPIAPSARCDSRLLSTSSFQKKAKKGIATPKQEIELIKRRLKVAQAHYEATYGKA